MDHILQQAFDNLRMHNETTSLRAKVERLEAEVNRLRASSFVTAVPVEQYERVIKAGDAMACHLVCSDLPNDVCGELMQHWNAAKEGKQS
jgi:hypothetical protein